MRKIQLPLAVPGLLALVCAGLTGCGSLPKLSMPDLPKMPGLGKKEEPVVMVVEAARTPLYESKPRSDGGDLPIAYLTKGTFLAVVKEGDPWSRVQLRNEVRGYVLATALESPAGGSGSEDELAGPGGGAAGAPSRSRVPDSLFENPNAVATGDFNSQPAEASGGAYGELEPSSGSLNRYGAPSGTDGAGAVPDPALPSSTPAKTPASRLDAYFEPIAPDGGSESQGEGENEFGLPPMPDLNAIPDADATATGAEPLAPPAAEPKTFRNPLEKRPPVPVITTLPKQDEKEEAKDDE